MIPDVRGVAELRFIFTILYYKLKKKVIGHLGNILHPSGQARMHVEAKAWIVPCLSLRATSLLVYSCIGHKRTLSYRFEDKESYVRLFCTCTDRRLRQPSRLDRFGGMTDEKEWRDEDRTTYSDLWVPGHVAHVELVPHRDISRDRCNTLK